MKILKFVPIKECSFLFNDNKIHKGYNVYIEIEEKGKILPKVCFVEKEAVRRFIVELANITNDHSLFNDKIEIIASPDEVRWKYKKKRKI
jgi:hypothetical protein